MNQTTNNISVKASSIEALIGQVADDFAARLARGERAQIEEYTAQYPEHAKIIEQVLRSVAVMQSLDLQPVSDVPGGNQAGQSEYSF